MPTLPWIQEALPGGMVRGGQHLLTGGPGVGKSAVAIQIMGALAEQGMKVLYLANEQSLVDLKQAIMRIHSDVVGQLSTGITKNVFLDDSLEDIDLLPCFLTKNILDNGGPYAGTEVVIVDSIQGKGTSSAAIKKYRALYEFCELAKSNNILVILIGHVTKGGQPAGPKTIEHNVDVVIWIQRTHQLRTLYVPKNRFGPERLEPIVLLMDDRGRLIKSPHATSKNSAVLGYMGAGDELCEGQATVKLPRYGTRPEINAPFLPSKKVKQLLRVLSGLADIDLTNLSYEISCYIPGQRPYRGEMDLPITVALLSSYLQQSVPAKTLFLGEVDLAGRIRPPNQIYLDSLVQLLDHSQWGSVERIFLSSDASPRFANARCTPYGPPVCELVDVCGVRDLSELIAALWPRLSAIR